MLRLGTLLLIRYLNIVCKTMPSQEKVRQPLVLASVSYSTGRMFSIQSKYSISFSLAFLRRLLLLSITCRFVSTERGKECFLREQSDSAELVQSTPQTAATGRSIKANWIRYRVARVARVSLNECMKQINGRNDRVTRGKIRIESFVAFIRRSIISLLMDIFRFRGMHQNCDPFFLSNFQLYFHSSYGPLWQFGSGVVQSTSFG